MTTQLLQLLHLLSLTMFHAEMLVDGGIFYSARSKRKTNLRNAQKALQKLVKTGYIRFTKYPRRERLCRFYYPTSQGLEHIGKKGWQFHKINTGLLSHDSLTAIFLVHMFRCSRDNGISCKWYPPFDIGGKYCDGAVSLSRDGKVIHTLIIETDTGTHDHREISEKYRAWFPYLKKDCKIVFLVRGDRRKNNLQKTIAEERDEQNPNNIKFSCPENFPPDVALLPPRYPPKTTPSATSSLTPRRSEKR